MICISRQEAQAQVKDLQKLFNKEGQPALKKHYERQLIKATKILNTIVNNDSGYKPPRTPWRSLRIKPWEV
jgi:hypothetical protein